MIRIVALGWLAAICLTPEAARVTPARSGTNTHLQPQPPKDPAKDDPIADGAKQPSDDNVGDAQQPANNAQQGFVSRWMAGSGYLSESLHSIKQKAIEAKDNTLRVAGEKLWGVNQKPEEEMPLMEGEFWYKTRMYHKRVTGNTSKTEDCMYLMAEPVHCGTGLPYAGGGVRNNLHCCLCKMGRGCPIPICRSSFREKYKVLVSRATMSAGAPSEHFLAALTSSAMTDTGGEALKRVHGSVMNLFIFAMFAVADKDMKKTFKDLEKYMQKTRVLEKEEYLQALYQRMYPWMDKKLFKADWAALPHFDGFAETYGPEPSLKTFRRIDEILKEKFLGTQKKFDEWCG